MGLAGIGKKLTIGETVRLVELGLLLSYLKTPKISDGVETMDAAQRKSHDGSIPIRPPRIDGEA